MIVWCAIAGVLLLTFLFRAVSRRYSDCRSHGRNTRRLLAIGREKDMFYVPGDIGDDDEFEDM